MPTAFREWYILKIHTRHMQYDNTTTSSSPRMLDYTEYRLCERRQEGPYLYKVIFLYMDGCHFHFSSADLYCLEVIDTTTLTRGIVITICPPSQVICFVCW